MSAAPRGALARAWHWLVLAEGSSRPLGLLRIAIALMLWARLADQFLVHADTSPHDLALAVLFHLATLLLLLGWWTRLASLVAAVVITYAHDWLGPVHGYRGWASHNIALLVLTATLLALTPSGRSYSLDRWRALARARREGTPPPPERIPLWSTRSFMILLSSVYLSTWANKTDLAYLSGERLASIFGTHYTGSAMLDGPAVEAMWMAGAVGVWALEGLLAFGLLIPRLRGPLALAGIALHGSFYAMFRVFTFSANMILLYLPWFPPDQVHGLIDRLAPPGADAASRRVEPGPARLALRLVLAGALLAGLGWAGLRDLQDDDAVVAVRLLDEREHSFQRTAADDRRARVLRAREEMQKWRDP